jgi:hypothetical protein
MSRGGSTSRRLTQAAHATLNAGRESATLGGASASHPDPRALAPLGGEGAESSGRDLGRAASEAAQASRAAAASVEAQLRPNDPTERELVEACAQQWCFALSDPDAIDAMQRGGWSPKRRTRTLLYAAALSADDVRSALRERLAVKTSKLKPGSVLKQLALLRSEERVRRVEKLASQLRLSNSEYSMQFEDDAEMIEAISEFVVALDETNADGTIVNEASNMRHWCAFCEHRRTAVWRRREWVEGDAVHREEEFVAAHALLFIYSRMQPRRGSSTPPRPSSAVNVLRGVARCHKRLGLRFVDLRAVVKVANALTATYCEKLGGPEALRPRRAEPMRNEEIVGLLGLESGVKLGAWTYVSASQSGRSFKACIALLAQAGFRGSEVALSGTAEFTLRSISRASVVWRIGGVDTVDPTEEQLRGLKVGDYAMIVPPPSKCDKFGIAWGNDPIYLAWHPTRRICAARDLQLLELGAPVHGGERRSTPLFTSDDGAMLKRPWLAATVKASLQHLGVESERLATLTLHSFRRYLACALRARNATDSQIMAALRWRSAKSLAAYAALNAGAYASLIDGAAEATVDSIRLANTQRLPVLSEIDVAYAMHMGSADAAARADLTDDQAARVAMEEEDD